MKKISIRLFILILILSVHQLVFSTKANGQNQTHPQNIYVGVGFSVKGVQYADGAIASNVEHVNNDTLNISSLRNSRVALQATYDYALSKRFSLGLAYSNQVFSEVNSAYSSNFSDSISVPNQDYNAAINRNNIAIRLLWHYVQNEHFDIYAGLRYGLTITTSKYDFTPQNTTSKNTETDFTSIQLALGWRYYINDNIGLSVEAALGKPHFLSIGANYRF
ncbi:MAG: outer membrane beta-barrel protein [Saprospiraceae bacterium]